MSTQPSPRSLRTSVFSGTGVPLPLPFDTLLMYSPYSAFTLSSGSTGRSRAFAAATSLLYHVPGCFVASSILKTKGVQ